MHPQSDRNGIGWVGQSADDPEFVQMRRHLDRHNGITGIEVLGRDEIDRAVRIFRREQMPSLGEEPEWMKLSTVSPAPAGSVRLRDVRAWHSATSNLSDHVRAIPSVQFYTPWFRDPARRALPRPA